MDLSKITEKINAKVSLTKKVDINGINFVIKVPTFEHQSIIDELIGKIDSAPEAGQGDELARRVVAYSLVSVDEESIGTDLTALMDALRTWPAFMVNTLGAAAINYRLEMAAKAAMSTTFEWFDLNDFKLKKDEGEAAAEAKKFIEEKVATKAAEEAASAPEDTEGNSFSKPS